MKNKTEESQLFAQCGYGRAYKHPKPLAEQVGIHSRLFDLKNTPTRSVLEGYERVPLPPGAEGWFAVPRISVLAQQFFLKHVDDRRTYLAVLDIVFKKLGVTRVFENYEEGTLPKNIQRHRYSLDYFDSLDRDLMGDFAIFPGQFGRLHQGASPGLVLSRLKLNQYALGSVAVACMLLTHPERIKNAGEMGIICPQDEFFDPTTKEWRTGYFFVEGERNPVLGFHSMKKDFVDPCFGGATGFVMRW